MAKVDKQATTSTFFAGVLALVPEADRAGVQATFDVIGKVEAARDHIADRTLAQADYSRTMDEGAAELQVQKDALAASQETLNTSITAMQKERDASWEWHESHKALLLDPEVKAAADRYAAKAAGRPVPPLKPGETPPVDTSKFLTAADQQKALGDFATDALGVMGQLTEIAQRHQKDFGEILTATDITAMTGHADVAKLGLAGVHKLLNTERYTKQATEAQNQVIADAEKRGADALRVELAKSAGPGYPVGGQAADDTLAASFDVTDAQRAELEKASDPSTLAAKYALKLAEHPEGDGAGA